MASPAVSGRNKEGPQSPRSAPVPRSTAPMAVFNDPAVIAMVPALGGSMRSNASDPSRNPHVGSPSTCGREVAKRGGYATAKSLTTARVSEFYGNCGDVFPCEPASVKPFDESTPRPGAIFSFFVDASRLTAALSRSPVAFSHCGCVACSALCCLSLGARACFSSAW